MSNEYVSCDTCEKGHSFEVVITSEDKEEIKGLINYVYSIAPCMNAGPDNVRGGITFGKIKERCNHGYAEDCTLCVGITHFSRGCTLEVCYCLRTQKEQTLAASVWKQNPLWT